MPGLRCGRSCRVTQQQLSTCGVEAIVCAHLWRQPAHAPAHVPVYLSEFRCSGRTLPLWPPWPDVQSMDGRWAPSNLYGRRELCQWLLAERESSSWMSKLEVPPHTAHGRGCVHDATAQGPSLA